MIEKAYHFLMAGTHHKNLAVVKKLAEKTNFNADLKSKQPEAFITVGNQYFMRKLYKYLVDYYEFHE